MPSIKLPLLDKVDLIAFQLDLRAFNADAVHVLANVDQAASLAKDKAPHGQRHLVCVSYGRTVCDEREMTRQVQESES